MKKIITLGILFVGVVFLAGCGQQQVSQDQPEKKVDTVYKNDKATASQQTQPSVDTSSWNTYKNDKYNFTIKYPSSWTVLEDKTLVGPVFIPSNLSLQDIQLGKYDKNKDCFFAAAFLSVSQDKKAPCKNNLGEITLGLNIFTKCQMTSVQDNSISISYMMIHPKTSNIISFDYMNNSSCKILFEKSLETLTFN